MNILKKLFNYKVLFLLLLIVFISLLVRLVLLDRIPTGMSDDEILFPLSSRAFFYSGKDLTEQWSPLSLKKPPDNIIQVFGKVPYMLFSPYFANVSFSMFTARLPYALFGGLFTLVLFIICSRFLPIQAALIISLVAALNPWSIFFSRTAYESPIGMYFAFIMFALLLYLKSWKILLALPFYFLSFYSYIGTPVILPLFTTIIIFYSWLTSNRKSTIFHMLFLLFSIATLVFYIVHLPNDIGANRSSQLLSPNTPIVATKVDWYRRQSIQTPITQLFINKYEDTAKTFASQYFKVFSPDYLFIKGEGQARFTLWSHGAFYIIDVVFFVFGFIGLYHRKRKEAYLLISLLLIGPIPSAIINGDAQYALRSSFMFPIIMIFIGYGVYSSIDKFKRHLFPVVVISFMYLVSIANFGYTYFFQNPVYNYESFGISGRILSRYIKLAAQDGYTVQILFNGVNKGLFKQYLFFNNIYNKDNHSSIASLFIQNKIALNNVIFADCKDISIDPSLITVIPFNLICTENALSKNILTITNYTDNQPIYHIYNDHECDGYSSLAYLNDLKISDFDIENLDQQRFCEKFFTRNAGYNIKESTGSAVPL